MNDKIDLEKMIVSVLRDGIATAISERLNRGYQDNPLNQLIDSVVKSRADAFKALIEETMDEAMSGDFKAGIKESVTHKMARIVVSKMEGEIEKQTTELRTSPEFRAKVTLAVHNAIKEISQPKEQK